MYKFKVHLIVLLLVVCVTHAQRQWFNLSNFDNTNITIFFECDSSCYSNQGECFPVIDKVLNRSFESGNGILFVTSMCICKPGFTNQGDFILNSDVCYLNQTTIQTLWCICVSFSALPLFIALYRIYQWIYIVRSNMMIEFNTPSILVTRRADTNLEFGIGEQQQQPRIKDVFWCVLKRRVSFQYSLGAIFLCINVVLLSLLHIITNHTIGASVWASAHCAACLCIFFMITHILLYSHLKLATRMCRLSGISYSTCTCYLKIFYVCMIVNQIIVTLDSGLLFFIHEDQYLIVIQIFFTLLCISSIWIGLCAIAYGVSLKKIVTSENKLTTEQHTKRSEAIHKLKILVVSAQIGTSSIGTFCILIAWFTSIRALAPYIWPCVGMMIMIVVSVRLWALKPTHVLPE